MPKIPPPRPLDPFWQTADHSTVRLYHGDVLAVLKRMPSNSVHTICTSPPYWGLRSYLDNGHDDKKLELGSEKTTGEYVERMVIIFRELRRVLRDDGTCWLNLGSSYFSGGMDDNGETLTLRDDLSPDELQHVLSELAAHFGKSDEVTEPD